MSIVKCKNCQEQLIVGDTNTHFCPITGKHMLVRSIVNGTYAELPELDATLNTEEAE